MRKATATAPPEGAYVPPDLVGARIWVAAKPIGSYRPDERGQEVRPFGVVGKDSFMRLYGVITCGPMSLVLFEGGRGGHWRADAIFEEIV